MSRGILGPVFPVLFLGNAPTVEFDEAVHSRKLIPQGRRRDRVESVSILSVFLASPFLYDEAACITPSTHLK